MIREKENITFKSEKAIQLDATGIPEAKKITDWEKEPSVKDLKSDFDEAKPEQNNKVSLINEWVANMDLSSAHYNKVKAQKGKSTVQPKVIRKMAEWRKASLSEAFNSQEDLFSAEPVSHEDVKAAFQNNVLLNNYFNYRINRVKLVDDIVQSLVETGSTIVKVGWNVEEGEIKETEYSYEIQPIQINPEQPDPEVQEMFGMVQEWLEIEEDEPDRFSLAPPEIKETVRLFKETGELHSVTVTDVREVTKVGTLKNHPTAEVCDYRNIYIDPACGSDINNAMYVIETFTSSYAELNMKGLYSNLEAIKKSSTTESNVEQVEATGSIERTTLASDKTTDLTTRDGSRQLYQVYEYWGYWDIHGNDTLVPIVASWVGETLIRLEENPYPDGKPPYVTMAYMPVKDSTYGESDGSLIEDNQKIIGAVSRGLIDSLANSANSQRGIPKGLLDTVNKPKFDRGEHYEFNPNAGAGIIEHTYPPLSNAGMSMIQMQNIDAESLTGVKAFSTGQGISGAGLGDTAIGVRSAMDASSKRELAILRRISVGIIAIGRKFLSMSAEFLEEEEVVRVTNRKFVPVRKNDLAGSIDLKLTISTAEADKAQSEQISFMLQTMAKYLPQEIITILITKIAKLGKMPDIAFALENYSPEPDPMQQQMQELELAYKQAEIALMHSEAEEKSARAALYANKIPVEQARAEDLNTRTQSSGLKLQQDVEGITHNRELEKISSQGRIQESLAGMNNRNKSEQAILNADLQAKKQILDNAVKLGDGEADE